MGPISSTQNPKIVWLKSLHKSATRQAEGVFVVEGVKEIKSALKGGFKPHTLFVRTGNFDKALAEQFVDTPKIELTNKIFEKLVYREDDKSGLVAVFKDPKAKLTDIKLGDLPFLIVAEAVEKPGNLGAIIRIADGSGADAVIVADPVSDIYNPNVIRSSVGCIFSKTVAAASSSDIKSYLKEHFIQAIAAELTPEATDYTDADFQQPVALILGAESPGLSEVWLKDSQVVKIPMKGQNNSLNVATAGAILAYEVVRQRS